jgi:hypothetical protein
MVGATGAPPPWIRPWAYREKLNTPFIFINSSTIMAPY